MKESQDSIELRTPNSKEYSIPIDEEGTKRNRLPGVTSRKKLFLLLEDPHSSRAAWYVSIFILGVIVLSIINFLVGSLPQFWLKRPSSIKSIEIFCVVVFTIEYCLRLFTSRVWYKWMIQPFNVVDLLAVLPFYLELFISVAISPLGVVRTIRIIRVFRIFKISRYSKKLQIIFNAFHRSLDTLFLLLLLLMISMVLFGTCIFYAEQLDQYFDEEQQAWFRKMDDKPSPFQSIPASFWWAIVTMCRIPGYGDTYPVTPLGRSVAALASLVSILVIAFPVAILGANFRDEWTNEERVKQKKANKQTD